MKSVVFASALLATFAVFADADLRNRPGGIRIGQRMTLRPYVCVTYTLDSNTDEMKDAEKTESYISINPGLTLEYRAENWSLTGSAYYQYHCSINGNKDSHNNHSWGESLTWNWSTGSEDGANWSAMITESVSFVNQNDDIANWDGKGLWRDRFNVNVTGALNRRFNEHWHVGVDLGFYGIDYDNDASAFAPLFSWNRWSAGMNIGYTLSKWFDFFLTGNYSGYGQDHGSNLANDTSGDSSGMNVHVGFGSQLTDRITYRLSGGWSRYQQGDSSANNSFTYNAAINWRFAETWATSLLASSYYRPSERLYGSSARTDSVSWGLSKTLVQGKLSTNLDICYRRDDSVDTQMHEDGWALNIITARLGVNYTFNRFFGIFAHGSYQTEINQGDEIDSHYDYNRFMLSAGVRFSY